MIRTALALWLTAGFAVAEDRRSLGPAPYCDATLVVGRSSPAATVLTAEKDTPVIIVLETDHPDETPYLPAFAIARECAHLVLGHPRDGEAPPVGPAMRRVQLDADCWAAYTLVHSGEAAVAVEQIIRFEAEVRAPPRPDYPSWRDRAAKMMACALE